MGVEGPYSILWQDCRRRLQPVPNAKVHFLWNDISPRGTSQADAISDTQGLFSLT